MARLLHHRRLRRVHVAIVIAALGRYRQRRAGRPRGSQDADAPGRQAEPRSPIRPDPPRPRRIVVNSKGRAVYTLSGDTTKHPKCTKASGCFGFWPPVTVSSAKGLSKAAGVKGKLGTFKRNGIIQVTLGGHPLYTFANDRKKANATGQSLHSFGGIWHVVKDPAAGGTSSTGSTTTSPPVMSRPTTDVPRTPATSPAGRKSKLVVSARRTHGESGAARRHVRRKTGAPADCGRPPLTRLPWWRGGERQARQGLHGPKDAFGPRSFPSPVNSGSGP